MKLRSAVLGVVVALPFAYIIARPAVIEQAERYVAAPAPGWFDLFERATGCDVIVWTYGTRAKELGLDCSGD